MNRRTFLKFIGVGGAAVLVPSALLAAPEMDVRGWRFGVWELIDHCGIRNGQKYYWCRCDCGAERVVGLRQLLSMDALSCDHPPLRQGRAYPSPDSMICRGCGRHRRFFRNGQGMRIWRCECEEGDIRAWLRYEYGPASSVQFAANMKRNTKNSMPRASSCDSIGIAGHGCMRLGW
jgi:hypothetical protein